MYSTVHIQELAQQVRGDTLLLLEKTPDPWLTWSPPGTSNHILWHSGHALWLQDALCIRLLTGQSELPTGWEETFGMQCRPPSETTDWPEKQLVLSLLQEQIERVVNLLRQREKEISQVADLYRRIIHGFHDEAKHQGEMYLLFKMCRARGQSNDDC
jgi:hypothetical protein